MSNVHGRRRRVRKKAKVSRIRPRPVRVDVEALLDEAARFYEVFAANTFEPFNVLRAHLERRQQGQRHMGRKSTVV